MPSMSTTAANTILSTLTTNLGTSMATNLALIFVITAGLLGLGFAYSRVKRYIARKG